uniref:Copia protein n=1 Tax=Cajanus cajan TaxID=3821 RepID=A0A151TWU7_CAJCA|nr:hypothetical protein KK1_010823 [Cajanus cajan]
MFEYLFQSLNIKVLLELYEFSKQGTMVRNKVRLIARGYNKQESIYFIETFAPIVRL